MSDEDEDIVLAELSDEDLVLQMHDDLYDGLTEEIEEGTRILLDRGWSAEDVLGKALVDGMTKYMTVRCQECNMLFPILQFSQGSGSSDKKNRRLRGMGME